MTFSFVLSVQRYQVGSEWRYMVRCTKLAATELDTPEQYANEGGRNFGAIMRLVSEWIHERIHR